MTAVVLIGPMGSGKTTYGKKLAKSLKLPFSDTDRLVSSEHGPISEIFERRGEAEFRELEHAALVRALAAEGVVATGGGIVLREDNRELIAQHRVIYLETSAKFVSRLDAAKRPLLQGGANRWQEIFDSRRELYEGLAHAQVFTGGKPIARVIEELEAALEKVS